MYRKIGFGLLISGTIFYAVLALYGIVRVGLFIIFPFLVSTDPLSAIPFFLILSGLMLIVFSPFRGHRKYELLHEERNDEAGGKNLERKFGGLIMIGPVPIIFGNDRRMIYILAAIAVAVILIFVLYYIGRKGYLIHP